MATDYGMSVYIPDAVATKPGCWPAVCRVIVRDMKRVGVTRFEVDAERAVFAHEWPGREVPGWNLLAYGGRDGD